MPPPEDGISRRETDRLLGRIEQFMDADAIWKRDFEEKYAEDKRVHRDTHIDLYNKIEAAGKDAMRTSLKVAGLTGLLFGAWEAIKHSLGGR